VLYSSDNRKKVLAMKIQVVGKTKNLSKKECKEISKFFLGLLVEKKETKGKTLCIEFGKKFAYAYDTAVEGEAYAYESIDGTYCIWISSKLEREKQIEVLAHEIVHIKQFIRNEYVEVNTEEEYWFNPSEIEAYGRTPGLIASYNKHF